MNSTISSILIQTSTAAAAATDAYTTVTISKSTVEHFYAITSLSLTSKTKKYYDDNVSPVTLSPEWSRMARLLFISFLSVIGSVGNIFMISSVMIEDHLKKAGNAFIVNVALADLLVTSILMPASTIVLLANIEESLPVCKVQWFFAACSFLVTILSLAATSIENYLRLCTPQDNRSRFNKRNTTIILLIMWCIGSILSGMQYIFNISFDYCTRKSSGLLPYQALIVATIILLPLVLTFYVHMRTIIDIKRFMRSPNFKPSLQYTWDISLARTNFYSFLIFILFWLPFGIVLSYHTTAAVANRIFYTTAWIGLSKSSFHNVIYCLTNRHFRNAYVNLFNYCCCKTTVSASRRQRHDVCRPSSSDVRVHIIPGYNMYSYTSPQRAGNFHGGKRDVHEL